MTTRSRRRGRVVRLARAQEACADVVAVDAGPAMIGHAKLRTPALKAVVADGARLPVRDHNVELVCFAQSWHWLDPATRVAEMHRVLTRDGRWAAWWSHADIESSDWLATYWTEIESACDGAHRSQAHTDWGPTIADPSLFERAQRHVVPWTRTVTADDWITDQASHSYVATLDDAPRAALLDRLRRVVSDAFPDGQMQVPFVTRLWIASSK